MQQSESLHHARNLLKTINSYAPHQSDKLDIEWMRWFIEFSDYSGSLLLGLPYRLWGVWRAEKSGGPVEKWIDLLTASSQRFSKAWRLHQDHWRTQCLKTGYPGLAHAQVLEMRDQVEESIKSAMERCDEPKELVLRVASLMIEERLEDDREKLQAAPMWKEMLQ